jgi:SAM-dependent methyltransferase
MFTQDFPEESESGRYYESEAYISHSNKRKTFLDGLYHITRKIMLNRKKMIVTRNCNLSSGSILDIGSGTGHFLNAMKRAGWKTEGIEINLKAQEYARSAFNLKVLPPQDIISIPDKSFDCITMWHVLEHFHDPFNYFMEIKRLIKPGGKVIVALPNSDSFDSKYYGPYWAAYDVPRHLWHFNPAVFSLFAQKNGFEVSSLSYLPLDVFYISILSEKYKGAGIPLVSGIIKGLLFFLFSFFRKSRTSSIIYILKDSAN